MTWSRRRVLKSAGALGGAILSGGASAATAPFQPTWESLAAGYRVPEWFRDAKFGIWAHWSAQCVPEAGDWYARLMYIQGSRAYEHHLKHYGHPTRTGFMDIDHLWRAERWDPEALIALYKAAGAKYFMALANHHDNFDTYASSHHAWNSVNVGPKRDIIGTWEKIVRREGLRFAVSNHSSHAWHWFQVAYGYDAEGPLAGQRYDAYRLTKADGRGKWWDGLDPQALYTGRHIVIPDGITSIEAMKAWHDTHDGHWYETPPPDDPGFARNWLLRCRELIDKYRPDLLYFDDSGLPLGQAGLDATAHFYNASHAWHGDVQAVVTAKQLSPLQRRGVVEDVERGFADDIRPEPWQTDTCIGDWHYDRAIYERHGYKSARTIVQRLADVVSKNGNLMLSIPVRGDGTIDPDEHAIVADIGAWMGVNGEAIFATRPWERFGEGPTRPAQGSFNEGEVKFTSADVRFTTKKGVLYAIAMDWPEQTLSLSSLAAGSPLAPGAIERVELLGAQGPVEFSRSAQALTIHLPRARPVAFAPAFRIHGRGLVET